MSVRSKDKIGYERFDLRKEGIYLLFILPAVLAYTVFTIIPLIISMMYSFTDWDATTVWANWVGLRNFRDLFSNVAISTSLKNTMFYAIVLPLLVTLVAIPLAVGLNTRMKTRNFQRAAFFFPSVPSALILGYIWSYILSPTKYGLMNTILNSMGLPTVLWLAKPGLAMASMIGVALWQNAGWHACIYLANLQSIPQSYYEAATVDGANAWQRFVHITFPQIAPSMTISVMLLFTGSLKVYDLPYSLTEGGPGYATTMMTQMIINTGLVDKQYAKSCAMSLVFFLIIVVCTVIQLTTMKRREEKLQ